MFERNGQMKRIFVEEQNDGDDDALGISRAKVTAIIDHARIFDAREANSGPEPGAATNGDAADILEDSGEDSVGRQLLQLIRDLNVDEQTSLVALAWVGRGTYSPREWEDALSQARQAHNSHTAEYLLGLPLLGDYLETGLAEIAAARASDIARRFA
jgi:hypothetical protein